MEKDIYRGCPVQTALQYIGGKWQIGILWSLRDGALRFHSIKEELLGISEKVLSDNLKFFEQKGMLRRQAYAEVPPRVEYELTGQGKILLPVIEKIISWGYAQLQEEKLTPQMSNTPAYVIDALA